MSPSRLTLVILAGHAVAAEFQMAEMRGELEWAPRTFDFTTTSPTGSFSGEDRFDSGMGLWLGGRKGFSRVGDPVGAIVGIDLGARRWSYGDGTMMDLGPRWMVGVGWAASDNMTLVVESGLVTAWTRLALDQTRHAASYASTGTAWGWTVRLRLDGRINDRWGMGMFLGLESVRHRFRDTDGISQELDVNGLNLGITGIWIVNPVPARL